MRTPLRYVLVAIVVAGLAVDAYLHFKIAPDMDFKKGSMISQGWLFRVQAGVAVVAAILLLIRANRLTFALAFVVAGSAVGALLLYHFVDVGEIGPLPNMYDPVWYADKANVAVAEGLATVAALVGAILSPRRAGTEQPPASAAPDPGGRGRPGAI